MKKIFTILGLVSLSAFGLAQTVVLNETFSFSGFLNTGNNSWYQHSGTINQLSADGSVAILSSANSEDSNKALSTAYSMSTASSSYKIEYSVDVTAVDGTNLTTAGDYFLSFGGTAFTADGTGGISSLPGRLFIKAVTSPSAGFVLGVVNNSGTGSTPSYSSTVTPFGTFINATVVYEVTKDAAGTVTLQQATLKVGSESIINTTGITAPPAQIASIAIREAGTGTSTTGNLKLDNLVVTSYAAVLGVKDQNLSKSNFVQNTVVTNDITFGAKANVKIFSVSGQLVKQAAVNEGSTLNISDLAKGTYLVAGEVNGQKVVQKIIKQ